MLNTPSDYHTFDHVVKKKPQSHAYKWSCLAVTVVICALMAVVWYWDSMVAHSQRLVKLSRTDTKNTNFVSLSSNVTDVIDEIRDTLGVALEQGQGVASELEKSQGIISTMVENAEGVAYEIEHMWSSGIEIDAKNMDGTQSDQSVNVNAIENDLSNLATEIKNEIDVIAANVESLVATAIEKLENEAHNAVDQTRSSASAN